jgi:hypothetical protein
LAPFCAIVVTGFVIAPVRDGASAKWRSADLFGQRSDLFGADESALNQQLNLLDAEVGCFLPQISAVIRVPFSSRR